MYSALLIDDEQASINMLKLLIEENCPEIHPIYTANSAKEAGIIMLRQQPNIVFTDIKMPGLSGIEFLNSFTEKFFKSIIVTAYTDYGIEAIRAGANDYLIKPIISSELVDAVSKVIKIIKQESLIPESIDVVSNISQEAQKILIKDENGTVLIPYADVIYFEANNNYTNVYTIDDKKYVIPKTLKSVESHTNQPSFYRCHKSYFVNINYFERYEAGNTRTIFLKGGHKIRVAVEKRSVFKRLLQGKS